MKRIKRIIAAFLAVVMIPVCSVTASAYDYSSSGVTFTVPQSWRSHGVNWDFYKNNGYYSYAISEYMDGLVEYAVEFRYENDSKMKFGTKNLFDSPNSKECKPEEYQTEDYIYELLTAGKDETGETTVQETGAATYDSATSDESANHKRIITGSQDEFYLISLRTLGVPKLITISGIPFVYQLCVNREIYSHVHNGILYQFRDDNAGKEEMHKLLATLQFTRPQTVSPTSYTAKSYSSKKSYSGGSSFTVYIFMFLVSIIVAGISRAIRSKKYDGNKKTISIRLITSENKSDSENENDGER